MVLDFRTKWTALVGGICVVVAAAAIVPILASGETEDKAAADRLKALVGPYLQADSIDKIAARVDGNPISLSRLDVTYAAARESGVSRAEVLNQLIDYELLNGEAARRGLTPTDKDVAQALAQTRASIPAEALQAAIDLAAQVGTKVTADTYWTHPSVVEGTRRALAVGKARDALIASAAPEAKGAALSEALARLRAAASVEILDPTLR